QGRRRAQLSRLLWRVSWRAAGKAKRRRHEPRAESTVAVQRHRARARRGRTVPDHLARARPHARVWMGRRARATLGDRRVPALAAGPGAMRIMLAAYLVAYASVVFVVLALLLVTMI